MLIYHIFILLCCIIVTIISLHLIIYCVNKACNMFLTKSIPKFMKLMVLMLSLCVIASCGIYKKTDARKVPTSGMERAEKNIQEGRGFRLFDSDKNKGGGVFDFATSNPMWRATITLLDFTPLSNVDYSGGMIITDWFSDGKKENVYTKITVRFLSSEVRADGINIILYKKVCDELNKCKTSKEESSLADKIKVAILKEAALIENNELTKRPDYKSPFK